MNQQQYGPEDVAESHRSLTSVPTEQEIQSAANKELILQNELSQLHKLAGMFKSAGWALLDQYLLADLRRAYAFVGSYDPNAQLADIKHVQGQIRAIESFRARPDWLEARRAEINKQLLIVRAQQGDPEAMEVVDEATTGR